MILAAWIAAGLVAGIVLGHVATVWSLRGSVCTKCGYAAAFDEIRYRCASCNHVSVVEEI